MVGDETQTTELRGERLTLLMGGNGLRGGYAVQKTRLTDLDPFDKTNGSATELQFNS